MYRIKEIAKHKGISISELSELIPTTQPNLSNIINNKTNPSIEMLQRIADTLGVHISELFANDSVVGFIKSKGKVHEINSIADIESLLDELKEKNTAT